jgi:general secretion pathway protein C
MDLQGALSYSNLRIFFYFLLLTAATYLASDLLIFFTELKLANHASRWVEQPFSPQAKPGITTTQKDYKALMERNLFAIKPDEARSAKETDLLANLDKLALTSLNCTLIGTVIQEGGNSWAIIRDNQSNKEEKASVGSMISGAKVVMILRNKVVLNFNGKDELLVMGIEKIRAENVKQERAGKETGLEEEAFKLSKEFVASSINDLPKIMSTVRVRPFLKDGKPQGFKISNLKEGSLLKTMGFQDEDVIKGVNGQDINSPEDVMKLYNTLKDSTFFSVTVLRNNQAKTLNYKVR